MPHPGGDFLHGIQDKIPVLHIPVGNRQLRQVDHLAVIQDYVQIQRAGAPVDLALPAGRLFDLVKAVQQLQGRQQGAQPQAAV